MIMLAGLVVLLLGGDTLAWWLVTDRIASEFDTWRQALTAEGGVILAGAPSRGGWPFQAELLVPAVTVATATPAGPGTLAWQAGQVRLVYAPWHPTTLDMLVEGAQTVRIGNAAPVTLSAQRVDVTIPLNASGQADGIAVRARAISVPLAAGALQIDSLAVRLRQADAFIAATAATVPGRNLPFGGTIRSLDLHAHLTGAVPPLRDPAATLAALRDGGQILSIDGLALVWGPLDVRGNASLGLDAALQPAGTASLQLTGYAEAIDALARSGAITRNDARVASTLLSLISSQGAGEVSQAELPLTLKDRTLSAGAIPLLRLPALAIP